MVKGACDVERCDAGRHGTLEGKEGSVRHEGSPARREEVPLRIQAAGDTRPTMVRTRNILWVWRSSGKWEGGTLGEPERKWGSAPYISWGNEQSGDLTTLGNKLHYCVGKMTLEKEASKEAGDGSLPPFCNMI